MTRSRIARWARNSAPQPRDGNLGTAPMRSIPATFIALTRSHGFGSAITLMLLAALGFTIYGWVGLHAYTAMTFSDSMDYVMMADFYKAVFSGEAPAEAATHYRVTRFPPLFSMIIGLFGGGSEQQHVASVVSLCFSVLAPFAVWVWIRREGHSMGTATVIAAALLLYPAYFMLSLTPVTEPFAIFLSAVALAIMARGEPDSSTWMAAAMLIGLSLLARTALLPLAVALMVVSIQRGCSWKRLLLQGFACFAPLALWSIYRRLIGASSYGASLHPEKLLSELGGWPDALWLQPWRLFNAISSNWGFEPTVTIWLLSAALTILAIIGLLDRAWRKKVDAWFAIGYIAMILIWPYPFELGRFVVLIYPICLLAAVEGSRWLLNRKHLAQVALPHWIPMAVFVAMASAPAYAQYLHRAMLPVEPALLDEKREQFFFALANDEAAIKTAEIFLRTRLLAAKIPEHVPEGECVYATMPQVVSLYGKRVGALIPFDLRDEEDARARLVHCRYFLLAGIDIATYDIPAFYPSEKVRAWTRPVMVSSIDDNHAAAVLLQAVDSAGVATGEGEVAH